VLKSSGGRGKSRETRFSAPISACSIAVSASAYASTGVARESVVYLLHANVFELSFVSAFE
jgi:hypothetical protein